MGTDQGVDLFQTLPDPSRHCAHSCSILGRRFLEMTQHCGQLVPQEELLMDRVHKLHAALLAAIERLFTLASSFGLSVSVPRRALLAANT
jgi:hypothetical protein